MADTISPVEVFTNHSADSESQAFYFALDFPDFTYCSRKLRVAIGRSDEDLDTVEKGGLEDLTFNAEDDDVSRGRKRSLSVYGDGDGSEDELHGHLAKKRRTTSPKEDDSDWSSGFENVPQHSRRDHITAVGGIGGPQIRSDDPQEDFVGIHPQVNEETGDYAILSISKKHLLIRWDDEHGWMMDVLGRNGVYLNESHYKPGQSVVLHHRDMITLRNLSFPFYEVGAMEDEESDEELSDLDSSEEGELEVVSGSDTTQSSDSDDENEEHDGDEELDKAHADELPQKQAKASVFKPKVFAIDDSHETEANEDDDKAQSKGTKSKYMSDKKPRKTIKLTVSDTKGHGGEGKGKGKGQHVGKEAGKGKRKESKGPSPKAERLLSESHPPTDMQDAVVSVEMPQRKRGPGRPPADGIMSKRERKERERADQAGIPYGEPLPEKVKSRPRTGSKDNGDSAEVDASAAAKKSKKPKREVSGLSEAEGEANETQSPKRDPTPEMPKPPSPKESDYPPEALVKPDDTYQGLLYTVLSEAKQALALPQIYEAMKNKWPHYRFLKETKGWESSVRHNLQACKCFDKAGRSGKGYLWIINPDVPFERKSKRAEPSNPGSTSYQPHRPTMLPHQAMHPPMHSLGNPYLYGQGYPGTNVQQLSFANGTRPPSIQNLQQHPPFTNNHNPLVPGQLPRPHQLVNGQRLPLPPHQTLAAHNPQAQPSTNYSSPYAPNSTSQLQTPNIAGNNVIHNNSLTIQSGSTTLIPMGNGAANPPRPLQYATQQSNPLRPPFGNGAQSNFNAPHQRLNSPAPTGQGLPRPRGQVIIEPPANGEIRAGRMPAVVKRFLAQLRKISGADADRTVKQAELAVNWIMKHPDSDVGLDAEMQEFGAPKSMIEVLRKLIDQQSNSSIDASQRGAASINAGHNAGQQMLGQNRPPIPSSSAIPSTATPNLSVGQSLQNRAAELPHGGVIALNGSSAQSLPARSPAVTHAPVVAAEQQNTVLSRFPPPSSDDAIPVNNATTLVPKIIEIVVPSASTDISPAIIVKPDKDIIADSESQSTAGAPVTVEAPREDSTSKV